MNKQHLKSDNLLQRYEAKQFTEIVKNAEQIEEFDMDLFFRIIYFCIQIVSLQESARRKWDYIYSLV
jgi:hypothetical protein